MTHRFVWAFWSTCLLNACGAPPASSAKPPPPGATAVCRASEATPRQFVTRRRGVFGGAELSYAVTAGDIVLADAAGAAAASLFSFSYVKEGVPDASARPVTFVYNGGPGSSSVWWHMGILGPRRVAFDDPSRQPTVSPFRAGDNPLSPLDVTDLVFIDPVGTGFSRLLGAGKPEDFYGVDEDARATAEFIQAWLTRHRRWNSPKYVVGESYGTVRTAALAKALAGGPSGDGLPGVTLNGVVLAGVQLGDPGDEASHQLLLPSLAAAAWYHGRVDKRGRTLEAFVGDARRFAAAEYGAALFAGGRLPEAERRAVAGRIASFTGLPEPFVLGHDLRVPAGAFAAELLRDRGRQLGAYDARYTLPAAASGGDPVADDPAMGQYAPGFVAAFHDYLQKDLGVTACGRYEVIAFGAVNAKWNYGAAGVGGNHAPELAAAMRRNPAMRLLVASGYYDLVTPFATAEYVIDHAGIAPERVSFKTYESGHMLYLGEANAQRFAADLRDFIGGGGKARGR